MLLLRVLQAVQRCHACRFPALQRVARALCIPQSQGRLLTALGYRTFFSGIPCYKAKKPREVGGSTSPQEETDEYDEEDDDIEDLLVSPTPSPHGVQNIFLVHPDVKWGPKKQLSTTADLQIAEAISLVQSLPNWVVVDKLIMSTKSPDSKYIFGKGNFQILTEKIKRMSPLTAVFLNVERVSAVTEKELEEAWGVKIFDRYTVVLNVFRYNARTREAKLQIALAELPLLRSKLKNEMAHFDQQGGGSRYIMGSGETLMEVQQRILKERELKIKKSLEKLRKKRKLLRTQRKRQDFPVISVMGYTNCGKTTLVKALTGDANLQPRDQLFATLDVTAHGGLLPCRMPVIFVDTIGFLSQLPHNLIESFSATLEDVVHSDLLIHVRDISHPEAVNQKASVMSALTNLNVPQKLLDTMIEVHNKIDLVEKHEPDKDTLPVSALLGHGMDDLKQQIEKAVMINTGRINMTIRVNLESAQLSWLYKEASVQEVTVLPDDGTADVHVIITNAAYGKYTKLFCR